MNKYTNIVPKKQPWSDIYIIIFVIYYETFKIIQ